MNSKQFVDVDNKEVDPRNAGYATEAGHAVTADTATSAESANKAASATTAGSAAKLTTARKIAGHAFDGSGDVVINAGDVGAYTKAEIDSKLKLIGPQGVNWKGIGLYIEKMAGIVTIGITGITTENIGDGWYSIGTIPVGYRPKSIRSSNLVAMVGNAIMVSTYASITIESNGNVHLRCCNLKKSYEMGGSMAWITT